MSRVWVAVNGKFPLERGDSMKTLLSIRIEYITVGLFKVLINYLSIGVSLCIHKTTKKDQCYYMLLMVAANMIKIAVDI